MRAVGHTRRNRAKRRQPACSGNWAIKRLSECVGVKSASKCTRHSWAALKSCRRPPVKVRGISVAMKSSGTWMESCSSNAVVPTGGNEVVILEPYLMPH